MHFIFLRAIIEPMSSIQIEVKKNANESGTSLLRRFSRKVMDTGMVRTLKGSRYNERSQSKLKQKKSALKRMTRAKEFAHLRKLGKIS